MHDQRWAFGVAYDALVSQGRYDRTWVGTMPVFPGRTPWYADRDVLNIHQGMGISRMADNPELILTFLETMMTEEWQILLSWGEEGIDYYVDANGMFYRSAEQVANRQDMTWRGENRLEAFLDQLPKLQGTLSCGNSWAPGHQPVEFQRGLSDYNRMFLEAYGKGTWRDFFNDPPSNPVYYPAWQISPPSGSPASIANAQMEDIAVERLPGIIMGPVANFDAAWADYVAVFDMINVEAFEAAITAGLQERIEIAGGL
jgi:putative aldouronate transport system substrate-binding protein